MLPGASELDVQRGASPRGPARGPGCSPDGRCTAGRPTPTGRARDARCSRSRRCPRDRSAASRRRAEIPGHPAPGTRGAAADRPLETTATPSRSCDRCHNAPLRSPPACALLFTSVYANDSLCPSFQPVRANTRTSLGNVYSAFTPTPGLHPALLSDRRRRRASDRDRRESPGSPRRSCPCSRGSRSRAA